MAMVLLPLLLMLVLRPTWTGPGIGPAPDGACSRTGSAAEAAGLHSDDHPYRRCRRRRCSCSSHHHCDCNCCRRQQLRRGIRRKGVPAPFPRPRPTRRPRQRPRQRRRRPAGGSPAVRTGYPWTAAAAVAPAVRTGFPWAVEVRFVAASADTIRSKWRHWRRRRRREQAGATTPGDCMIYLMRATLQTLQLMSALM